MKPENIDYQNLAERASLIIEIHDNLKVLDGFQIPVHFNGLLKNSARLVELEKDLEVALRLVRSNLKLYEKHGDFSDWWNEQRYQEYEQESKAAFQTVKKPVKPGFVYLMLDNTTKYFKIGYSRDPKYRERTLQSEKPTVSLLATKPGTVADEKELQVKFSAYRVRGEWFDIPESVVPLLMKQFDAV